MPPENAIPQPTNIPGQQPAAPAPTGDAAIMSGHPAAEPQAQPAPAEPTPAPAVQLETVYIGNQKFEVTPEVAATMRAQQEMIQNMNTPPNNPAPANPVPADDMGIDPDLMYTDPGHYTRLVIEQATKIAESNIEAKYTTAQNRERFFNDFYGKNSDLKEADDIVRNELAANFNAWQNKPSAEVHDLLADKVRTRILGFVSRYGQAGNVPGQPARTTVEPGQQQPASVQSAAPAEEPKSASNILRLRRQKLRGTGN